MDLAEDWGGGPHHQDLDERPSSASIFDHGIEMMQLDPFRQFGPFFFTQTDHIELLHNHPSQLWPQLTGRQLIMPVYDVE